MGNVLLKKLTTLTAGIIPWSRRIRMHWHRLPVQAVSRVFMVSTGMLLLLAFILFMVPALQEMIIPVPKPDPSSRSDEELKTLAIQKAELAKSIDKLDRKFKGFTPRSPFLVINTSGNKFYLYRNRRLYREGECSTGSYILLKSENRMKWLFKTPRGRFIIQGKTTSPVWKKPDWAFVELGMPVPPENHPSRYEYGVLGDYALSLGQGYLIHGTLYKRFLGLPVTHGCVRLNDEDLEAVYTALQVGSRVYIY